MVWRRIVQARAMHGSIPASTPKPIRTPGLLIMIPPTMNMMPVTIAADVPIWWGLTTSAAVLGGNWSAKLEYDFLKLDDLTFGPGPFRGDTFPASREIPMFKVGLNYRFWSLFGGVMEAPTIAASAGECDSQKDLLRCARSPEMFEALYCFEGTLAEAHNGVSFRQW